MYLYTFNNQEQLVFRQALIWNQGSLPAQPSSDHPYLKPNILSDTPVPLYFEKTKCNTRSARVFISFCFLKEAGHCRSWRFLFMYGRRTSQATTMHFFSCCIPNIFQPLTWRGKDVLLSEWLFSPHHLCWKLPVWVSVFSTCDRGFVLWIFSIGNQFETLTPVYICDCEE